MFFPSTAFNRLGVNLSLSMKWPFNSCFKTSIVDYLIPKGGTINTMLLPKVVVVVVVDSYYV